MDKDELASLHFTHFGLANSSYEFYNGASRKVLKCLKKTKATLIGEHGLVDAGAGTTDEDYLTWKEATMTELKKQLHLEEQEQEFEFVFELRRIATVSDKVSFGESSSRYLPFNSLFGNLKNVQLGSFDSNHPYLATVFTVNLISLDLTPNTVQAIIWVFGLPTLTRRSKSFYMPSI